MRATLSWGCNILFEQDNSSASVACPWAAAESEVGV